MSLKNEIYSLIDNIREQEDELERCKNNKDNQNILSNISKNKQRIDSLSSLIVKDSQIAEEKIKILTEEILGMESEISNSDRPNTNFSQKDLDQNLIKEKFILKTIKVHENELIQIDENLKLLKEEKLSSSNELLNLMSLRENYEELIKTRSKYIFKPSKLKKSMYEKTESNVTEIDLNKLNDNNFDINKTKLEYHDILNIQSINKLSNFIYKIISSNIVATFSSLLIELNLKNVILSCIENAYNKFTKNNFHFTYNKANSFIREISVNIVNSDIKISNLFIEPQFEILLKYIFKLFSIEKTINDELKFVNNDYSYNKNNQTKIRNNSRNNAFSIIGEKIVGDYGNINSSNNQTISYSKTLPLKNSYNVLKSPDKYCNYESRKTPQYKGIKAFKAQSHNPITDPYIQENNNEKNMSDNSNEMVIQNNIQTPNNNLYIRSNYTQNNNQNNYIKEEIETIPENKENDINDQNEKINQNEIENQNNKLKENSSLIKFRNVIISQGAKSIFRFQRMLSIYDRKHSGLISFDNFYSIFKAYYENIPLADIKAIFSLFDTTTNPNNNTDIKDITMLQIKYDDLLTSLIGNISLKRQLIIKKVYDSFEKENDGKIMTSDIKTKFNYSKHPDVLNGKNTAIEIYNNFNIRL